MPALTLYCDATDGTLLSQDSGDYEAARAGTGDIGVTADTTGVTAIIGQRAVGGAYQVRQYFLAFDLSAAGLPADAVVTAASLTVWFTNDSSGTDFTVEARQHDWGTALAAGDWVPGAGLAAKTLLASLTTAGLAVGDYSSLTNAGTALVDAIQSTQAAAVAVGVGAVLRAVVCSSHQTADTPPGGTDLVTAQTDDWPYGGRAARLTVTYAVPDRYRDRKSTREPIWDEGGPFRLSGVGWLEAWSTGTRFAVNVLPQEATAQGVRVRPFDSGSSGRQLQLEGGAYWFVVGGTGKTVHGPPGSVPDAMHTYRDNAQVIFQTTGGSAGTWSGGPAGVPNVKFANCAPGGWDVAAGQAYMADQDGNEVLVLAHNATGTAAWSSTAGTQQVLVARLVRCAALNRMVPREIDNEDLTVSFPGASQHGALTSVGLTLEEEITLDGVSLSIDSASNLLPANATILSVTARVTQAITGATNWSVGDPTTATRFLAYGASLTLGTTAVGLNHLVSPPLTAQVSAAKVRITTDAPGSGKIRVAVHFLLFTPPQS